MKSLLLLLTLLTLSGSVFAKLKVATLHPVVTDLANQIGGDKVEVIDLIGPKASPHHFNPTPKDLARAQGSTLYFAAGKGMESYLGKLKSNLAGRATIIEVGRTIPSIKLDKDSELYVSCPCCGNQILDPHWWNSVKNIKRASSIVYKAFSKADPANKGFYKARDKAYRAKLDQLNQWIIRQLNTVPRKQRYLATAHAAFAYFCKEYGWKTIAIQGLNAEQATDAKYLSTTIGVIKDKQIKAIFPEKRNNPKALQTIVKATGASIGKPLIADGSDDIIAMFKTNVTHIVTAMTK